MRLFVRIVILLVAIVAMGCGGRMPEEIGVNDGMFAPCPDKPNCVSSFAADADHHVDAIAIIGMPSAAWKGLQSLLGAESNVEVVASENGYLHAVYTSNLMRYRDDLEFFLREGENEIAIRSASRVGHSDMGVNRERVESIRSRLAEEGLVKAAVSD